VRGQGVLKGGVQRNAFLHDDAVGAFASPETMCSAGSPGA
jgi:hypothetical protein